MQGKHTDQFSNHLRQFGPLVLFLVSILLAGCTRTIASGTYGPLQIGESKESVLDKLSESEYQITPERRAKLYIDDPSPSDFSKLDLEDGVLVWLNHEPWPLRVELADNLVVRKWGQSDQCKASNHAMNIACHGVRRLDSLIEIGMPRQNLYEVLSEFDKSYILTVGNFLIGYQEFRTGDNPSIGQFKVLLLRSDKWVFHGMKEKLWLPHYHSEVSLYFSNNELDKIEHFRFLFELP